MKRYLLVTVLALSLTACASDKITPAESVLLGCDAFASALNVLAPLRADGKLCDGVVNIVNTTKAGVDPVCEGNAPDVGANIKSVTVDSGVKVLTAIAAQYLGK